MSKIFYITLLSFLFVFSSMKIQGQDACQANFEYEVLTEISSLTYRFTNISQSSTSIKEYSWNFGDGSSSKQANPEHQYLDAGVYPVTLKIATDDGCSSIYTDTLYVETIIPPGCIAYFTFLRLTGSVDYTYAFSDHSVSGSNDTIISWYWDFGDGSSSSVQNPIHQYMATGVYNVQLTITTKDLCQSSYSHQLLISNGSVACQASYTATVDTLTNPLKVYFHDNSIHSTSITSWNWYFDDGDSSALQDPVHTFPYAGVYYVRLKINTQGGCSDEISYPISVGNPQPYNMWGRVYAGPYVIDKCIAYLYKQYNNHFYKPIDTVRLTSVNDTLGVYYFFQVPEGEHKVKVLLPSSSQYANDYAPTYYGDNEKWLLGSTLSLFQDISMANVNLEEVYQSNGSGVVMGKVVSSNSQMPKPEDVEILLYDNAGMLSSYTFTDPSGHFKFENLSPGVYSLAGEVTGLMADVLQININQYNDTVSNVVLNLSEKRITGIIITEDDKVQEYEVYPNPVHDLLNVRFEHDINMSGSFHVYNAQGQEVLRQVFSTISENIQLDFSSLMSGIYFVQMKSEDLKKPMSFRIIKK